MDTAEGGEGDFVCRNPAIDNFMGSKTATPIRLTLVQTGKKKRADEVWELLPLESCITSASKVEVQQSSSSVQLMLSSDDVVLTGSPQRRRARPNKVSKEPTGIEVTGFINCNGIITSTEYIAPANVKGRDGMSILLAISCCNYGDCSEIPLTVEGSYILLYEILTKLEDFVDRDDMHYCAALKIEKPRLLKMYSLKKRRCLEMHWLDGNKFARIDKLLVKKGLYMLMLIEPGYLVICKLNDGLGTKEELTFEKGEVCENVDIVWSYDPSCTVRTQSITSVTVSYCTDRNGKANGLAAWNMQKNEASPGAYGRYLLTVAAGTNDGFLLVWKFLWDDLVETGHSDDDATSKRSLTPIFHKTIPICLANQDVPLASRIVSVRFLPIPESYVVAVATYMGLIAIWDIRHGSLDGELNTYNAHRHLTTVGWTHDLNYLLVGSTSAMCVEWQKKSTISTLSYDSWKHVQQHSTFENLCWSLDSTSDDVYFAYDDGLLVSVPVSALNKRNTQEVGTTYVWEPTTLTITENEANEYTMNESETVYQVEELISKRFEMDMDLIRGIGICITRNGSKYRGSRVGKKRDPRLLRNKVLAQHCVKATNVMLGDVTLSLVACGGNAGILHWLIKD
ncbi:hypothetical protein BgAZ_401620 [Babesia gibsoni]|uniref:Uncharacterized protein n=1 Tax=Babesia gibsoni TaxID=33632 RepID=A0AAD8LID7_BABGI|nr:hypothetical protein BgAZ_401620 [Babesia gibsoni]